MSNIVIYHAGCPDGFTAAWAAWKKLGDAAEYVPAQYGDAPPDVFGKHVSIVDFSYPRDILAGIHAQCESLVVLDHHKTAEKDLADLPFCRFDMSKSGAMLAWEHFHPGKQAPSLVHYVQDRDLWQWKLPNSREVSAALGSYSFDFFIWEQLAERNHLALEGVSILRYQRQLVERICHSAEEVLFAGHLIQAVNSPVLQSEVAGQLAEGRPFGAAWFQKQGEVIVSLRSRDGGEDVSEIAKARGGGGHRNAAGFKVPGATAWFLVGT